MTYKHPRVRPNRKSIWHHIRAPQVPHQPPGELRHLQAHAGRRALDPLPVLQRLLREHVLEGNPWLHPDGRRRAAGVVHRRVQRHLSSHRGQRGLFHPGRKAQRLQLRQQPCAAGRHRSSAWWPLGCSHVGRGKIIMGGRGPRARFWRKGQDRQLDFILLPGVLLISEGK